MNIVFRCDSSSELGLGHLTRCLAIAELLAKAGHSPVFVMKNYDANGAQIVESSGYPFELINRNLVQKDDALATLAVAEKYDARHFVVDNYSLDKTFEEPLTKVGRVLVIDDIANRAHVAHSLIDYNFSEKLDSKYNSLVSEGCKTFLGPSYTVLRSEFIEEMKIPAPPVNARSVICFFGGTDSTGELLKLARELESFDTKWTYTFVATHSNPRLSDLKSSLKNPKARLLVSPPNFPHLLRTHQLFLGAGGTITGERMFVGLTGFVATVADNQVPSITFLESKNLLWSLGSAKNLNYSRVLQKIESLDDDALKQLEKMDRDCQQLVKPLTLSTLAKALDL